MAVSGGKPSFSYTSSASLLATVICRPTRVKIVSSSERLRCIVANGGAVNVDDDDIDGGSGGVVCVAALQSSVIATSCVLAKLFHSWNRLLDRFSKSKLPTNGNPWTSMTMVRHDVFWRRFRKRVGFDGVGVGGERLFVSLFLVIFFFELFDSTLIRFNCDSFYSYDRYATFVSLNHCFPYYYKHMISVIGM